MQMFLRYVFCSYIWFIFGCVVVFESWVLMWPIGQSYFFDFYMVCKLGGGYVLYGGKVWDLGGDWGVVYVVVDILG